MSVMYCESCGKSVDTDFDSMEYHNKRFLCVPCWEEETPDESEPIYMRTVKDEDLYKMRDIAYDLYEFGLLATEFLAKHGHVEERDEVLEKLYQRSQDLDYLCQELRIDDDDDD